MTYHKFGFLEKKQKNLLTGREKKEETSGRTTEEGSCFQHRKKIHLHLNTILNEDISSMVFQGKIKVNSNRQYKCPVWTRCQVLQQSKLISKN